jgi:CheY-like chemotaxis protein
MILSLEFRMFVGMQWMSKRVLSVGQCLPDDAAIRSLIEGEFEASVASAMLAADALDLVHKDAFDLVLVNRKLDADYSDGIEIIRQMKADPQLANVPVMLITNFAQHQEQAVALGAQPGFGKLEYDKPETLAKLAAYLG